jgi:hypothetical protein
MMFYLCICFSILVAAVITYPSHCIGKDAIRPDCTSAEILHRRDFFYVGGRYVYNSTLANNLVSEQMYMEKLTPASGITRPRPLVFFQAGGSSGAVSFILLAG